MAGPTTAGLAALIEGEPWHYVGETGEPAFESGWANGETGAQKCAFRLREAGIVDIVFFVETSTAVTRSVFQLPAEYRPTANVYMPGIRRDSGDELLYADIVEVNTSGYVSVDFATVYAANDKFIMHGSFFLDAAATLP